MEDFREDGTASLDHDDGGIGFGNKSALVDDYNSTHTQIIIDSLNATLSEHYNLISHATKFAIVAFYCVLIVVSLIGNSLVIRVLLCVKFGSSLASSSGGIGGNSSANNTIRATRSHRLHIHTGTGTSKLLIVNLAISDLLLTTFNIPINLIRYIADDWPFGETVCKLVPFVQSVSAYCSAWTMLMIAFERFRKIIQQQKFHRRLASQQHHPHSHHQHRLQLHPTSNSLSTPNQSDYSEQTPMTGMKNLIPSSEKTSSIIDNSNNRNKSGNTFTGNVRRTFVSRFSSFHQKRLNKKLDNCAGVLERRTSNGAMMESSFDSSCHHLMSSNENVKSPTTPTPPSCEVPEVCSHLHISQPISQQPTNACQLKPPSQHMTTTATTISTTSTTVDAATHSNSGSSWPILDKLIRLLKSCFCCVCLGTLFCSCCNQNNREQHCCKLSRCNCFKFALFKSRQTTEFDSCLYRRLPAWFILSLVWAVSIVLSYPHSQYARLYDWPIYKHSEVHPEYMYRCRTNLFPDHATRVTVSLNTFITQYAIPMGLTSIFYLHIGIFLWRRETVGALSEGRRALMIKRKRRRVRMLIFVVLVFAACWAPLNFYNLAIDHGWISNRQGMFFSVHLFAMSSVCYNPFIYCWLNETFRKKARAVLRRLLPCHGNLRQCFTSSRRRIRRLRKPPGDRPLTPNGFEAAPSVSGHSGCEVDGPPIRLDLPTGDRSSTWSSSTMSATGKQQAISELISMSALLEQDLLDSSKRFSNGSAGTRSCGSGESNGTGLTTTTTTTTATTLFPNTRSTNPVLAVASGGSNGTVPSAPNDAELAAKQERLALTTTQSGKRRLHIGIGDDVC